MYISKQLYISFFSLFNFFIFLRFGYLLIQTHFKNQKLADQNQIQFTFNFHCSLLTFIQYFYAPQQSNFHLILYQQQNSSSFFIFELIAFYFIAQFLIFNSSCIIGQYILSKFHLDFLLHQNYIHQSSLQRTLRQAQTVKWLMVLALPLVLFPLFHLQQEFYFYYQFFYCSFSQVNLVEYYQYLFLFMDQMRDQAFRFILPHCLIRFYFIYSSLLNHLIDLIFKILINYNQKFSKGFHQICFQLMSNYAKLSQYQFNHYPFFCFIFINLVAILSD
ncbi:transmembrane protein, putative (macronuclear) [Tetrahymena thermophila SB210]|uniref:Transmembrane protein, putative n=1 Tax=Tetrahymena thermophila (strain SB210) TaxID=312017 RepID=W7XIT9_TETTS|nr:transmembrane protein, putative [Tetrahymena thermophila SB210]EWS74911.1 transmembrane protein, putative [Tetrahymena thermophila SB210]|eukprot:XP_012652624.1 transmembrane protein, putative [Tetrahymena thermophila SB210]